MISPAPGATPDAVPRSLVERLPQRLQPYARMARLDRPIGWWLLLLPCWWSEALAARIAGHWPSLWTLLLFLIGAVAMRGAGSTWNDITDRDLDAQVARTRNRPLPSGQVTVTGLSSFSSSNAWSGCSSCCNSRFLPLSSASCRWCRCSLPVHEALHEPSSGGARACLRLGCADGFAVHLGTLRWRLSCSMPAVSPGSSAMTRSMRCRISRMMRLSASARRPAPMAAMSGCSSRRCSC